MALITLQDVTLSYGGAPLLDRVNLNIERGERTCLVGRNGAGKSSLMRLLAGEIEPDSGQVLRQAGLSVTWLPQEVPHGISGTAREIAFAGTSGSEEEPWRKMAAAEAALTRLGVALDADFATLSGGAKRRVMLARALADEPDLLILDEPTNHLDIATVEWLEEYLRSRIETVIFVTHDRAFLRRLAARIIDLDRGQLAGWDCDYDTFLQRKQQLLDDESVMRERMGRLLEQEEAWLRQGVKARRTRNEGRVRALKRLREEFRELRLQQAAGNLTLQSAEGSGRLALKVENLTFAYAGQPPLVKGFNLRILRGERIGIVGPNGSGKTTLLQLLTGQLKPQSGFVEPGTRLQTSYFDQLRTTLNPEKTLRENIAGELDTVVVNGVRRHVLAYLQDYLFEPERARTPVKALSGGERNRLMLARHFLEPGNLLAMDEPTNDLDLETLELLEEQLANYEGTLLLVSHDRTFINNIATTLLLLDGSGGITQFAGGYDEWCARRPTPQAAEMPASGREREQAAKEQHSTPRRRFGFNEKHELKGIGQRIEKLECEQSALEEKLLDPLAYRQPADAIAAWQRRLSEVEAEIERLFIRWEELEALRDE